MSNISQLSSPCNPALNHRICIELRVTEIQRTCRKKNQLLYVTKTKDVMRMEKVCFLFGMHERSVERFGTFKLLSLRVDDGLS